MLARIDSLDQRLHSYAEVTAEHALAQARAAEEEIGRGEYRGPLHGVPIAVKDLAYTKGVTTAGGLAVLSDFIPSFDGTVVRKLAEAGSVLLGKLNLTEGAMGGYHRDFKIPVNPWRDDLWAGASSSGSGVATAAGLCFASLGTDTGGSIRYPAMANGVVGLKPTYGRVSRYGVLDLAETLDHVGPMTRRSWDAAVVFEAIAGFDPEDPTSLQDPVPDMLAGIESGVQGLRLGFDRAFSTDGVEPGLTAAIEQGLAVLESLGAEIVEVRMPDLSDVPTAWDTLCSFEAAEAHAANYPSRSDEYGGYFREYLALGASVTADQRADANRVRQGSLPGSSRPSRPSTLSSALLGVFPSPCPTKHSTLRCRASTRSTEQSLGRPIHHRRRGRSLQFQRTSPGRRLCPCSADSRARDCPTPCSSWAHT